MPRTASNKNIDTTEEKETKIGCFSMVNSQGSTSWHIALINEGMKTHRTYGHTPLVDDNNDEIVYTSKASARAFIDGYNFRDKELFSEEEVG